MKLTAKRWIPVLPRCVGDVVALSSAQRGHLLCILRHSRWSTFTYLQKNFTKVALLLPATVNHQSLGQPKESNLSHYEDICSEKPGMESLFVSHFTLKGGGGESEALKEQ